MSISFVLSECLSGTGEYNIKPYCEKRWLSLRDEIVWSGSDRIGYSREVRLSDSAWKPIGEKIGISFNELSVEFEYEFKILMLALYTSGIGEGMPPLKWSTITHGVRSLRSIAKFLFVKNIHSWMEFDGLKILARSYYCSEAINYIEATSKPRLCVSINTAIKWLNCYGLLGDKSFNLISNKIGPVVASYQKDIRKKHPVIPSKVLKQLISKVISELDIVEEHRNEWIRLQSEEICRIESGQFRIVNGRYRSLLRSGASSVASKISRVKGLVNTLVLAFTGMRDGEVLSLANDCLTSRVSESGDVQYSLISELTKTTEGSQHVEWVCGEVVAKYLNLISSLNDVVYEKARVIIEHLSSEVSDDYLNELQQGLKHKYLFVANYSLASCGFYRMNKRPNSAAFNISDFFKIPVGPSDIEQLERLGCNYKSVAPNNSDRHQRYKPGDYFNFTPHQFRHTFAWFIIANRLGELDDIRYQYKHLWQNMTLVYAQRGYESIGELLNIADEFSDHITNLTVSEIVEASLDGSIAGHGGARFSARVKEMLGSQATDTVQPHFKDMNQLVDFISKNSSDLRGVGHGYCTKAKDCKVKNVADPSHCIYCDGYIATARHLTYWKTIEINCEDKIKKIESAPDGVRAKLDSFSTVLKSNLAAARVVIKQLEPSKGINQA
ncbi:hypothetical protein FT643_09330 [Ketobacter sp. MCCC 1A13808]|uniref:hypothetical protein n=1 Tax=Ketobacter sp. MCCC 1A13808 TaxID=2602738 RepID=UPI0012EBB21D|nr:hypothetical protein [Ketobacter sp. MCCC 1A13808]MVF12346.1 hypothetical protein [Ketobacter sp. MCCC 1A13808]